MGRAEALSVTVYYLASTAATVIVLLMLVPSIRSRLQVVGRRQVYAWQMGRHLARHAPARRWVAMLAREDLPAEGA